MRRIASILAFILLTICIPYSCKSEDAWDVLLKRYLEDPQVGQLLLVKCEGSSSLARAEYLIKSAGRWEKAAEGVAYIGANGIGKTREGDRKSPEGDFDITGAFGIKENPGTAFDYIRITPDIVAVDEDCEYYNRIVDVSKVGQHGGEMMSSYVPQYNYGMTLNFNPTNEYPKGSNIFLHCPGKSDHTAGCVAIDEAMLLEILTTATPGFKICIHLK